MIERLLTTLGLLVPLVVLPLLEISDTHVFNPTWPPHARFHEVWQLCTNGAISLVALWLAWKRDGVQLAGALGLCVMGCALGAHALAPTYGGALIYPGGPGGTMLGIPAAILVPLVTSLMFFAAILLARHRTRSAL